MGAGEWIALAGFVFTLAVSIFSAGVAIGRIRAVAAEMSALAKEVAALRTWKEDVRVDLGSNFVRRTELRDAIESAIAPVRSSVDKTHELVTRIASRMHIPPVGEDL